MKITKGERVVLSWGELYYPVNLHKIIVATRVSPIIPSKTRDKWPIPKNFKIVFANDLISERNIENPTKITIVSAPIKLRVNRKVKLYSDIIDLVKEGKFIGQIKSIDNFKYRLVYPSVFYGRGRGFHGIAFFKGVPLKLVLEKSAGKISKESIREKYFIISAVDGYRITVSYSELFNRNDNSEFLLIDEGENSIGGRFRIYPSPDFFSDRAVKAVNKIILKKI